MPVRCLVLGKLSNLTEWSHLSCTIHLPTLVELKWRGVSSERIRIIFVCLTKAVKPSVNAEPCVKPGSKQLKDGGHFMR